jgi:amino acid adenylation domain-containing protein
VRIDHYLHASAERHAAKTALVAGETRLSYGDLESVSKAFATALIARGARPGDRVVLLMDNGWRTAVAIFGCWMAGVVICPVNPSAKPARLSQILDSCRPFAVILETRLQKLVSDAAGPQPKLRIVAGAANLTGDDLDFDALLSEPAGAVPKGLPDTDLAAIIYTSGSTGEPKGVMLGHDNLDAAVRSITSYLGNTSNDVLLGVLPLSFGYGLNQLLSSILVGGTLVIEKSFAYPHLIFERIRDEQVTGLALVPTMLSIMMQTRDLSPQTFESLRYVTTAAAALPAAHGDWLCAFLPSLRLYCMYGQTECTRISFLPPEDLDRKRGTVGIAIPGTTALVVDETGNVVPPGVVGELVVAGPHVMRGYWNNDAATARALRADAAGGMRLHTGDLFTCDADGYLTFVARKDDIIKSRGEKVAPQAVEAVLQAMPGVTDALVFGVAHDVFGQAVKAIVVAPGGAMTEKDVMRHCAQHLEAHMVPTIVEFRDFLPTTDTGKVSRRLAAQDTEKNP